jgi:hypothetical protein
MPHRVKIQKTLKTKDQIEFSESSKFLKNCAKSVALAQKKGLVAQLKIGAFCICDSRIAP